MNEKRFELSEYSTVYRYSVIDNIQKGTLKANEIIILLSKQADKIDEQQATINELKAQLKQKEQEERLYANEILKLNKEAKEVLDFKSLGGDY
jgi:cell shape-determining protein MreC